MYFCGSKFRSTLKIKNMSKIRILYVASEINPFLQTSEVADFVRKLPQAMQEKGMEIAIIGAVAGKQVRIFPSKIYGVGTPMG